MYAWVLKHCLNNYQNNKIVSAVRTNDASKVCHSTYMKLSSSLPLFLKAYYFPKYWKTESNFSWRKWVIPLILSLTARMFWRMNCECFNHKLSVFLITLFKWYINLSVPFFPAVPLQVNTLEFCIHSLIYVKQSCSRHAGTRGSFQEWQEMYLPNCKPCDSRL